MEINIVNVVYSSNGTINSILVTDGNEQMFVTPYQVFNAMLQGTMTSKTARIALYGLDLLVDGNIINLELQMSREQLKKVKSMIDIEYRSERAQTPHEKKVMEQNAKASRLEQERAAYKEKRQQQFEENRKLADAAMQQGLVNLSDEERLRRRQEYFKNKKKNGAANV